MLRRLCARHASRSLRQRSPIRITIPNNRGLTSTTSVVQYCKLPVYLLAQHTHWTPYAVSAAAGGAFNLSALLAAVSAREFNRSLAYTNVSQVLGALDNFTLFVPTDAAMEHWADRLQNTVQSAHLSILYRISDWESLSKIKEVYAKKVKFFLILIKQDFLNMNYINKLLNCYLYVLATKFIFWKAKKVKFFKDLIFFQQFSINFRNKLILSKNVHKFFHFYLKNFLLKYFLNFQNFWNFYLKYTTFSIRN